MDSHSNVSIGMNVGSNKLRVLHVSDSDGGGGAARASLRIHQALMSVEQSMGVESHMLVRKAVSGDLRVNPIRRARVPVLLGQLAHKAAMRERRRLRTENRVIHSVARQRTGALSQIRQLQPDAVVLHWLGDRVLSVKQIGQLSRRGIPIYWVLHDTWAFCGAEHYPHSHEDRRFIEGYRLDNRPAWESGLDINRITWARKTRHWTRPIHIIAPSRWIAKLARQSMLMQDWPIDVVPNPVDVAWWGAVTRDQARQQLGVATDRRIVLFGAIGGEQDPRKGADLLRAALAHLARSVSPTLLRNLLVLTFGGKEGTDSVSGLPVRSVGRLNDEGLRQYYSAADVMVVPSRMDNLPQTAIEPIACGTPVVGFNIGGMPDIITNGVTGRLVEPFSTEALSDAILWSVSSDERLGKLSRAARSSAITWCSEVIAKNFSAVVKGGCGAEATS